MVYVDSVFVLNALMDYLLVLCAARLAGIPLRRRRYLLAGLLGGAYAVAVFLPGLGFLSATPVKLAAGILLALAAYGGEAKLLRLTLLLFAVSCAMAGCVLALGLVAGGGVPMVNGVFYTDVDAKVLLTAAAAAYLVLTVVFRAAAGKGVRGELVCGHYEGIDQRFIDECVDEEISIGDFVLTGGEIPAMAVADAVCRMVPGVLPDEEAFTAESHWDGLLEHPQYTRPENWRGREVPEVLLSGHHANIEAWRREMSLRRTKKDRPDLFVKFEPQDRRDRKILEKIRQDG